MARTDYLVLVALIFGVFICGVIGYQVNKDRVQKLETRVNALEAEEK